MVDSLTLKLFFTPLFIAIQTYNDRTTEQPKLFMTTQEQIIAIAELDGRKACYAFIGYMKDPCLNCKCSLDEHGTDQDYLNSYDAIIPAIDRHWKNQDEASRFGDLFINEIYRIAPNLGFFTVVFPSPAQLSEALLRATNKWKD